MCGLTGCWTQKADAALRASVEAMSQTLNHRGPDARAVWLDESGEIGLGHTRLKVIDLSENGAQPMHSACNRYVLVFNGEIYNHQTIRKELENRGLAPNWRGHSDTEILLAGFVAWGVIATLQRTVGMFSLALWDKKERRLTLGRDRFGEKPLYYGWSGRGNDATFVFGSELKALRASQILQTQSIVMRWNFTSSFVWSPHLILSTRTYSNWNPVIFLFYKAKGLTIEQ